TQAYFAMLYYLAANLVALIHFAFVLFVVAGGLLVWRWPRLAWLHLPAVLWGTLVISLGWICPLTPLENTLLSQAGMGGYQGEFVERYIMVVIYPEGLTRPVQILLGALVTAINLLLYGGLLHRQRSRRRGPNGAGG